MANSAFKVCGHSRQDGSGHPELPRGCEPQVGQRRSKKGDLASPVQSCLLLSEAWADRLNPFMPTCGRFSPLIFPHDLSSIFGTFFFGMLKKSCHPPELIVPTPHQVATVVTEVSQALQRPDVCLISGSSPVHLRTSVLGTFSTLPREQFGIHEP